MWLKLTPEGGASDHTGWHGMLTSGGNAKPRHNSGATMGGPLAGEYDDCYAYLAGTWQTDLRAEATVYRGAGNKEMELLFRVSDQASPARIWAYECLFDYGVGSVEIARWNGAPTDYSTLATGSPGTYADGDRIAAVCAGTNPVVITCYVSRAATPTVWEQILTYSDSSGSRLTSGAPGIGAFVRTNASNPSLDYGIKDYTVLPVTFFNFAVFSAENPLSAGGIWTNASAGTGGNAALAPNQSMKVRLSDDSSTMICCEQGSTNDYDDSLGFVPGFPGNQRVTAVIYRKAGYTPTVTNHEMIIELGCVSYGTNNKRSVHLGFNYAGGYFVAGFNGDLISWDAPPNGNMSSPWTAFTGLGGAPADGDVMRAELNRAAKTVKMWQNNTLVIDLQWNDTAIVTSAAQAVLNDLGDGAGLGALRRIGGDAVEGSVGWRNVRIEGFC